MDNKKFTMGNDLLKSLTVNQEIVKPVFKDLDRQRESIKQFEEVQRSIIENKAREKHEEIEYRNSVLSALQGIEKNTALLTEMSFLLQKNNEKQDETFELLVEILGIMKSGSKEEAESTYRTVMKKVGEFSGDVSTIQTLYGIGQTVFNAYQSLPF